MQFGGMLLHEKQHNSPEGQVDVITTLYHPQTSGMMVSTTLGGTHPRGIATDCMILQHDHPLKK